VNVKLGLSLESQETQIEVVWEQKASKNIWTWERWVKEVVEKIIM